jgi:hypothetical protein
VHGSLRASRRLAWIVAAAATTVAVLEAIALALLAPLQNRGAPTPSPSTARAAMSKPFAGLQPGGTLTQTRR